MLNVFTDMFLFHFSRTRGHFGVPIRYSSQTAMSGRSGDLIHTVCMDLVK